MPRVYVSSTLLDDNSSLNSEPFRQVDTLSELFVAWDEAITSAEDTIVQLEREKVERKRLGLESE